MFLPRGSRKLFFFLFWVFAVLTVSLSMPFGRGSSCAAEVIDLSARNLLGQSLARYVDTHGLVDYAAFQRDQAGLSAYLSAAEALSLGAVKQQSEQEQIAFWLNVYNALTLRTVLLNYPIHTKFQTTDSYPAESIRQIPDVWDAIHFKVAGASLSLNDIENSILRGQFHEPRIHLALVCAARSCPPLRRELYAASTLNSQLDDQARRFLATDNGFFIVREQNIVRISPIFQWYQQDFSALPALQGYAESVAPVLGFIARYVSDDQRSYLRNRQPTVEYIDYDWGLNQQQAPQG